MSMARPDHACTGTHGGEDLAVNNLVAVNGFVACQVIALMSGHLRSYQPALQAVSVYAVKLQHMSS